MIGVLKCPFWPVSRPKNTCFRSGFVEFKFDKIRVIKFDSRIWSNLVGYPKFESQIWSNLEFEKPKFEWIWTNSSKLISKHTISAESDWYYFSSTAGFSDAYAGEVSFHFLI